MAGDEADGRARAGESRGTPTTVDVVAERLLGGGRPLADLAEASKASVLVAARVDDRLDRSGCKLNRASRLSSTPTKPCTRWEPAASGLPCQTTSMPLTLRSDRAVVLEVKLPTLLQHFAQIGRECARGNSPLRTSEPSSIHDRFAGLGIEDDGHLQTVLPNCDST